jgi:cytochrome c-type biogenesis protein CcmH
VSPRLGSALAVAAAVVLTVGAVTVAALVGPDRPRTMEQQVQTIAAELRCPVCQNLSVADSPSRLARQIRSDIERRLRLGQDPAVVREAFVARYGEWIDLSPSPGGLGLVVWAAPAAALVVGGMVALLFLRRRRGGKATPAPDDAAEVTPEMRARIRRDLALLEEPE